MEQTLGEATVTASKILMVVRGDTIVYNADAFRLSKGSMLDALVKALPGVTLDEHGRIYQNGEFVKKLLVNGRNFFNGDARVALANLPAYTVHQIKVYHETPEQYEGRERTQEEKKNDPLVMDVRLKREYAQGWISNYEVAGGTALDKWDELWLGRIFAMRYTNHSSLALYGTANNLNDGALPQSKGEWKKVDPGTGRIKTLAGGVDFDVDKKGTKTKFHTTLQAQRQSTNLLRETTSETFMPSASVFQSERVAQTTRTASVNLQNSLQIKPAKDLWLNFTANADYAHQKGDLVNESAEWQATAGDQTLYERRYASQNKRDIWSTKVVASGFAFPHGEWVQDLDFGAKFNYRHENAHDLSDDFIAYHTGTRQQEVKKSWMPARDYDFDATVIVERPGYSWTKKHNIDTWVIYQIKQEFASGHRTLDYIPADTDSDTLISTPPSSATDWLFDAENSFHTVRLQTTHHLDAKAYVPLFAKGKLFLNAPLNFQRRRIRDYRSTVSARTEHRFTWDPTVSLSQTVQTAQRERYVGIRYNMQERLPSIYELLDTRDTSNPLVRRISGGESLKKSRTHTFGAEFKLTQERHARQLNITASYSRLNSLIATAHTYNPATGIHTYQPRNINGNWRTTARVNYTQNLGAKELFSISANATYNFLHSVDWTSDVTQDLAPAHQSVDNSRLNVRLRLDWRIQKVRISAKGTVDYAHLSSDDTQLQNNAFVDYTAGLSLTAPLPAGFDFTTDAMLYARRKYADHAMNTTDVVWNATLEHTLGTRKQWTLRLMAYDILQQINTVRREVNAQGRTETHYNTLPSYLTLHVIYRLDVRPKKK